MEPDSKTKFVLSFVALALAATAYVRPADSATAESGHTTMVMALAFSPDGRSLFVTSDHDLILKSVATDETLKTFRGHRSVVRAVAVSHDGKTLLSSSSDGAIKLWGVETGRVISELAKGTPGDDSNFRAHVDAVAFSPDSRLAASGGNAGEVTLWDVSTGKAIHVLHESPHASIECIVFSPRGDSLFTTGGSGKVVRWDVRSGREILGFEVDPLSGVNSLSISADGNKALAVAGLRIELWDAKSGKKLLTFSEMLKGYYTPRCAAFTPDGVHAVSGDDSRVFVWDLKTGRRLKELDDPPFGHVESIAVSPDGELVVVGDIRGNVRGWRLRTGEPLWPKVRRGVVAQVGLSY